MDLFTELGKATKPGSKDLKRLETIPFLRATKPPSQETQILAWLRAGRSLTPMEALNMFNCMSLAQRMAQLRTKKGFNEKESPDCYIPNPAELIKTSSGKWIAKYKLIQK